MLMTWGWLKNASPRIRLLWRASTGATTPNILQGLTQKKLDADGEIWWNMWIQWDLMWIQWDLMGIEWGFIGVYWEYDEWYARQYTLLKQRQLQLATASFRD